MTMATTRLANPPQKVPAPPAPGSAERAAVIAVVVAVVSQPMLHPTGPGNSSPVDLLIVAAIVTAMVWLAGTHRKLRAPYVIPAGLFIAAGAASGLVSPLPTTALVTVAIDILLFAWCTTAVNVLAGPRAMRYALVAWSWSGIAWAAIFVAAWLGHVTPLEGLCVGLDKAPRLGLVEGVGVRAARERRPVRFFRAVRSAGRQAQRRL